VDSEHLEVNLGQSHPQIEDYALIGDGETAALVSRSGSIDWLCWPRFDSDACFAALLGTPENGRWLIEPVEPASITRRYRPDTLILETRFETATGAVLVVDFMPNRAAHASTTSPAAERGASDLVRIVIGERGEVRMRTEIILRFGYGAYVPWVTHIAPDMWRGVSGPNMVTLRTHAPLHGQDKHTIADFTIRAGQRESFAMTYSPSHMETPPPFDVDAALEDTEAYWHHWIGRCDAPVRWSECVHRSLITLRALVYRPTGGIVAAPTTSLPEDPGGERNWDYRFCWVRDATLTLLAFMDAGFIEEAAAWRDWLVRAVAGDPQQMQIMYGLAGERRLSEWEVPWLSGFRQSRPVRVGNAAHSQLQLDVYGELMDVMHQARNAGVERLARAWAIQRELLESLEEMWRRPDYGIWEIRGEPQHFTHSKIMCWVAFDRAIKDAEHFGFSCDLERWKALRNEIHDEVCSRGFDPQRNCFVQAYGSKHLDASLLLIPSLGFLPGSDARVRGTVKAIERELLNDIFVHRYRTSTNVDGLQGGEGAFLACSFWLVDAYLLCGRRKDAEALFERLLALANDVGLFAEQYDPVKRHMLGNFPQAFTHLALITSAFNLAHDQQPAQQRAEQS
jgi:GH15 family glucan-1,4-alpha-glucosidase